MKIKEARLCVNCDEIHKGYTCPKCGVGPSYWIALWIDLLHLQDLRDNYRTAQENKKYEHINGNEGRA